VCRATNRTTPIGEVNSAGVDIAGVGLALEATVALMRALGRDRRPMTSETPLLGSRR